MPVAKKEVKHPKYGEIIVVDHIDSHANDPFVVEKVEKAKEVLSKLTLPENRNK